MPIHSGRKGTVNPLSSPPGKGGFGSRSFDGQLGGYGNPGLGFRSATIAGQGNISSAGNPFRSKPFATSSIYVNGVTRDGTGAALASCVVRLFRTHDNILVDQSLSDGSGLYTLRCSGSGTFYVVAYKAGAPDLAGTTINTLIGV